MDVIEYAPTRGQYAYTFGGVASAMRVRPGTVLRLCSEDAFNGSCAASMTYLAPR
jgi:hypothetical protein